jgi:ribosomal-protein-alanine acetyltransferase
MLIKPVGIDDLDELTQLHAASFGDACWSKDQMRGSLELPTTQGWGAMSNRKLAGFILCQTLPDQREILTFCVDPALRRQKIGELLIWHAITDAQHSACNKVFLEVAADNDPACKLYQKLGFKLFGNRPGYYQRGNGPVDAHLYEFPIRAA